MSRSILPLLAENFDPRIIDRGVEYQSQRRVSITGSGPGEVRAIVRGTGRYRVDLRWDDTNPLAMTFRCGCPYFEQHENCKHVWAALLQAQAQHLLPPAPPATAVGKRRPARRPAGDFDPDDGFDPDDDADPADDWDDPDAYESTLDDEEIDPTDIDQSDEDDWDLNAPGANRSSAGNRPRWARKLDVVREAMTAGGDAPSNGGRAGGGANVSSPAWPANRRLLYVIDAALCEDEGYLVVELMSEDVLPNGRAERPRPIRLARLGGPMPPDERDATIVQMLIGAADAEAGLDALIRPGSIFLLPEASATRVLNLMIATGRCRLRSHPKSPTLQNLTFDAAAPPWRFVLRVDRDAREPVFWLRGHFARGGDHGTPVEQIDADEPAVVIRGGVMVRAGGVERFDDGGAFELLQLVRDGGETFVPEAQLGELLGELFSLPRLPRLELPDGARPDEIRAAPRPKLIIRRPVAHEAGLLGELLFDYAGVSVPAHPPQPAEYDRLSQKLVWRDLPLEAAAEGLLAHLGLRLARRGAGADDRWRIAANRLSRVVGALVAAGWIVEAEGRVYRRGGRFNVRVSSGIDWFELQGGIDFDGQTATLPQLLAAVKAGDRLVQLGDGSFGVLPEEWLQQYGLLAALGQVDGEQLKFSKKQVGVLDALVAALPEASWDAAFARVREELSAFAGVRAVDAPEGFVGELRPYQREGLGWIQFLRNFGFGGCLADDMGLGKTIQVLAMLRQRKRDGVGKPTLVVVPRSLVFNWLAEARKFTPDLRVVDHSGAQRAIPADKFRGVDLILSTYGTVRRDAAALRDVAFDYVILDEAQAIKNSQSESAKAVRLLRADHRLALSGTPVQNHLGELWSLFDFLNPGLLGSAGAFKAITQTAPTGNGGGLDAAGREALARALRPFILRRTKQQVATDLPEKLEQTLVCELDRDQRKLYDELREHFRATLLGAVARDGISKNRMQILEALLRLRQAACHPGLIDKSRVDENSAKLDALIPQLDEVIDEGHKVLVFSQFTSFLSIVRKRLDARGVVYEYLDGKTTDRQARVRRFQNDPDCRLFLISLKAGGLGLNLTAAEYVFLLDPWWNPAVEQQAIDRTHRIGQTRQVFAYRLIAKDTVEEKVLELQKAKRDLAEAIITADNSLISKMGREELEMLLS